MTTLVGIDTSTNFTEGRTLSVANRVIFRAYTAIASGSISALYAYMQQNAGSSAKFKIGVWRVSDGALIASTGELSMPASDGWVSGAASGSIVSGTDYYLGIMRNGTASGYPNDIYWFSYTTGAVNINVDDTGTYPTVPSTISLGGSILSAQIPIYADGSAGDTTPPTLSAPVGSATASTTATVGATTDEGNGTLYAVVTGSATQPSVAQIKAGNDHTGSAAVWSGNVAVSSTGAKTLNATGLTGGSSYYVHLVHTDAAANDSNRVTSSQWTQLVKKVKLKLDLAAAGETVDGIVWANQSGAVAGAEIGEFTGQTIATGAGADAGFAVLKVPVTLFGGGSLNVGDTVQMFVRNSTKSSDLWPATIIEE